jgi:hypothetical protein
MALTGVSHRRLAEAAGFRSHSIIRDLLTGRRHVVNATSAAGMAALLGVSVEELFDRQERACA